MLGAPGGRLKDAIAAAADATGEWSLDDRVGDVLRSALRHRWAQVQTPPGTDSGGLVARLLDRLLALDAADPVRGADLLRHGPYGRSALRPAGPRRPAPFGAGAADRPARAGRGPRPVRPVRRGGTIAADLRAGIEARLSDLDRAEGRLRYDELAQQAAELDRHAAELDSELARTVGARLGRRDRGLDPDTLVVRRHELRTRGRSARQDARRIAQELAKLDRPVPTVSDVVGAGGTPAEQRNRLAAARRELVAARDDVEPALRGRVRLVAATTRGAYLRGLPRADFDVVVIAGTALPPEAYYLAGLSTRSVIAIGDSGPGRAPEPYRRPAPHLEEPPRRRPGLGRSGRVHPVRPRQPPG